MDIVAAPANLDLLTVTLNSNSDALLVRCTILLAGVANVWIVYHYYTMHLASTAEVCLPSAYRVVLLR